MIHHRDTEDTEDVNGEEKRQENRVATEWPRHGGAAGDGNFNGGISRKEAQEGAKKNGNGNGNGLWGTSKARKNGKRIG